MAYGKTHTRIRSSAIKPISLTGQNTYSVSFHVTNSHMSVSKLLGNMKNCQLTFKSFLLVSVDSTTLPSKVGVSKLSKLLDELFALFELYRSNGLKQTV
jgi:hypothetical protein